MNDHSREVISAGLRAVACTHVWAIREEWQETVRLIGAENMDPAVLEKLSAASRGKGPDAVQGVATIAMRGPITSTPSLMSLLFGDGDQEPITSRVSRELRQAANSPDVKAIVLDVDSPGGTVDYVPELAKEIRAVRKVKPITAIANNQAGSAAYWLASQATEMSVAESGDVGSIGVFKLHEDLSAMADQMGVKMTLIKAGKHKAEALPYFPLSTDAKEYAQSQVDTFYGKFVGDVARGRRVTPSVVKADFGQGRMMLAEEAKRSGLVDRVESLESVQRRLRSASASQLADLAAECEELDARFWDENRNLFVEDKVERPPMAALTAEDRYALLDGLLA